MRLDSALLAFTVLGVGAAEAKPLFSATISGPGPTQSTSSSSIRDIYEQFPAAPTLQSLYPTYNGTQGINATINIRGVTGSTGFIAGTNTYFVTIPAIGANLQFGGTQLPPSVLGRSLSVDAFNNYLDTPAGNALISDLIAALIRESPIDPLAGNPGSLEGTLIAAGLDFLGSDSLLERKSAERGPNRTGDEPSWLVGAVGGGFQGGDYPGQRIDGRLEKSFGGVREGSRSRLKFDLPISYVDLDGAKHGSIALGAAYEFILGNRWSLEPRLSAGVVAAPDAGTAGIVAMGSLTSRFRVASLGKNDFYLGNMVAEVGVVPIEVGDFKYDPGVQNTVFRNGIAVQRNVNSLLLGRRGSLKASITNTILTGSDVFVDNYYDVGVSYGIGSRQNAPQQIAEAMRVGLNFTYGEDYSALNVNFGWRF